MSVPLATSIVHANCVPSEGSEPCKASAAGREEYVYNKCSHICGAAQVGHNLLRPDGVLGVKVEGTAALCWWNDPGEGATFPPETELGHIIFRKPWFGRTGAPRTTAMASVSDRGRMNPIPEPHLNLGEQVNSGDEHLAALSELYASLREDFDTVFTERPNGSTEPYRAGRSKHT